MDVWTCGLTTPEASKGNFWGRIWAPKKERGRSAYPHNAEDASRSLHEQDLLCRLSTVSSIYSGMG